MWEVYPDKSLDCYCSLVFCSCLHQSRLEIFKVSKLTDKDPVSSQVTYFVQIRHHAVWKASLFTFRSCTPYIGLCYSGFLLFGFGLFLGKFCLILWLPDVSQAFLTFLSLIL